MKAKLIKERFDFYGLRVDDKIIATNDVEVNNMFNYPHILSLKNCQAVENGYDLDELSSLSSKSLLTDVTTREKLNYIIGYQMGFQKALELLGDKKFNEEDVKYMFQLGFNLDNPISENEYNTHIQSLQQTEWDVEIEMEYQGSEEDGKLKEAYLPKLDSDGCLILKRVEL